MNSNQSLCSKSCNSRFYGPALSQKAFSLHQSLPGDLDKEHKFFLEVLFKLFWFTDKRSYCAFARRNEQHQVNLSVFILSRLKLVGVNKERDPCL